MMNMFSKRLKFSIKIADIRTGKTKAWVYEVKLQAPDTLAIRTTPDETIYITRLK